MQPISSDVRRIESAMAAAPLDPAPHAAMAEAKRSLGDQLGALAHLIAAQALAAHAAGARQQPARDLCDVATGYFMKGDHAAAAGWYGLVLKLDPDMAAAHQNLAAIHAQAGRMAEAEACRDRAYSIQRVFVEGAGNSARRVLILCAGRSSGNVPFEILLPTETCVRIKYAVDYAAEDEDGRLPAFDAVFNAIGDPDVAAPLAARQERFGRRCGRPLLNPPAAVARTRRDRLPDLLGGLDDVVAAPCVRFDAPPASRDDLAAGLAAAGMAFPLLYRPVATHGGEGLVRCENIAELEERFRAAQGAAYVTAYREYRSADGRFRKYRMVFVDREAYPYHLAVSAHWMVHYVTAGMMDDPQRIEEERRFLDDPAAALGARAMAAVAAIGRRLDLDYGGVDFALLPDGRVLVFEANATMLVHRERIGGPLAHKNPHVEKIVAAFERRLASLDRTET